MAILLAHFPKLEISEDNAEIMFGFLRDLSQEQFIQGVKSFCLSHKEIYPNTNLIAHIREYALEDEIEQPTAGEAWEMVLTEMNRCGGAYGIPNCSNLLVQKAINSVGWKDICLTENVDVVRAHFMKIYDSFVARHKKSVLRGMI